MPTATPANPEAFFSSTVKDFRGDLHTFRGNTYEEWYNNGAQLVGEPNIEKIMGELMDRIAAEKPAPSSSPPPGNSGGGTSAADAWKYNPPHCDHGEMRAQTYKAKSGPKKDQDVHTFFCPQPREAPSDQKCTPVDGVTRKPWGTK